VIHLLHDLGAATWFGGSLMGATSLNAAAAQLDDPSQRSRISTAGWSRWAPVNAAGLGAHLVGGAGLLITDWDRVRNQEGVGRSTAIKTAVTGVGLGVAAWSAALNRKMAAAGAVPVQGATEPGAGTPPDVAKTQQQLKLVQWLNPLVSGAIIALGSWHEEQQRPAQVLPGLVKGAAGRPAVLLPTLGAAAFGLMAARRQRRSSASSVTAYPAPSLATPTPAPPASPSAPTATGPATTTLSGTPPLEPAYGANSTTSDSTPPAL
jgi:hypothetical protein